MTSACRCALACGTAYPEIVCSLIRQLTDPEIVRQIEAAGPGRQIDVTLFAANGRAVLEAEVRTGPTDRRR